MSLEGADAVGLDVLSVALIGPDEVRRKSLYADLSAQGVAMVREYDAYPSVRNASTLVDDGYDVVIIELDSDPETALRLIETVCAGSPATVMVYSESPSPDLLVHCMRAGVREFLNLPVGPSTFIQALERAVARRPKEKSQRRAMGRLLVFTGAKGGGGVTTIACNFAAALAQESEKRVLMLDLCIPLGDVAVTLGIEPQYSSANAIQDFARLDANFLSKLLTKHSSGLMVLAAPDRFTPIRASAEAIERLISIGRQDFDYVVVDAGSSIGTTYTSLFDNANMVYLVMQVSIAELRNANRLIAGLFVNSGSRLEVVLNRYNSKTQGIDEDNITRALTKPATWKVPSDYIAVRQAQNTGATLVMSDSAISKVIRQMARLVAGKTAEPEKKRFGFFK